MVSTIQNREVKEKDAGQAVVVAITSRAVFKSSPDDDEYGEGLAFRLLKALQRVNERLLEENPTESLLFDVILITTDSQQQQQSSRIISSTTHYGLEISRFCFSSGEDFIESLQKNNVQLFLTTDRNEASQASQKGVLSALLDQQVALCPSDQLRIMFSGNTDFRPDSGTMLASRQSFWAQLGQMRRRFGMIHSPLCFVLVTSHGGRESCARSLLSLRSSGVSVDEAYCLAGAPRGPILSLLQPHFILEA